MQDHKDGLREQKNKDGNALFYVHLAMHENILPRVASTNTTKEAFDTLEITYQGLDNVKTSKLKILRRNFESLLMKDTMLV